MRADYVCSKAVTQDSCLPVSQILGRREGSLPLQSWGESPMRRIQKKESELTSFQVFLGSSSVGVDALGRALASKRMSGFKTAEVEEERAEMNWPGKGRGIRGALGEVCWRLPRKPGVWL